MKNKQIEDQNFRNLHLNNVNIITKHNLCIGCGICSVSCPHSLISIKFDKNLEYKPIINESLCTNCGICLNVCPMSSDNLTPKINKAYDDSYLYGLNQSKEAYLGYELSQKDYIKSSSGGMLSAIANQLLKTKRIDAIIHAEQCMSRKGEYSFKASVSKTIEENNSKRSSFYYPIEFSDILKNVLKDDSIKSVLLVATPCVISAVSKLKAINHPAKEKIRYMFSLICGHSVSGQFAEILKDDIRKDKSRSKLKFREKSGIVNAGDFKNSLTLSNGAYYAKSRFDSQFTNQWRSLSYCLNGCKFCPDFFGIDADACFKDAWGLPLNKKQGETAFVINNNDISEAVTELEDNKEVTIRRISIDSFAKSQAHTVRYKTIFSAYRAKKHKFYRKGVDRKSYSLLEKLLLFFEYILKSTHILFSKYIYRLFSKPIPKKLIGVYYWPIEKIEKTLLVYRLFKEKVTPKKEVLYASGFGYRNIGDEAQLRTNLLMWREFAPEYNVVILSPNPDYTRRIHGNYDIIKASRNTLWGLNGFEYGGIGEKKIFTLFFIFKFLLVRFNLPIVKYFNCSFLLSPESTFLLSRIKNAKVLHIGGGGFLTGATQSRLYDNIGLLVIAKYFNTDVILSGHNIGIWKNRFHRYLGKKLRYAKYIGLRDNSNSVSDLLAIKVFNNKKVFPLFDDALFCDALPIDELKEYFKRNKINPEIDYIAVNCSFTKQTKSQITQALKIIAPKIDILANENKLNVLLIPMHDSDIEALDALSDMLTVNSSIIKHHDSIQLVVSLFQNAYLTITTRHHPIIFSMSGLTPVVSVVFDEYFQHKNIGALTLFQQENNVILYNEQFEELLDERLKDILLSYDLVKSKISHKLSAMELKKGIIIRKYLEY